MNKSMEKQKDLISVIVPIYKVEKYLDRCVESLINQKDVNLEIILVDDGSPDNCPQMCESWSKRDHRISVIHKENGGLSDARNAGIKIAKGQYIAFIDADDYVGLKMYSVLLKAIKETDSDIACCKIKKVWNTEFLNDTNIETGKYDTFDTQSGLLEVILDRKIQQVVWNKLYNKNVICGIWFEKGKYHEDEFWTYQILGKAKRTVLVDYEGYFYQQRNDSIMGNTYSVKRLDGVEAKARRQEYLENNYPELAFVGKRNFLYTCLCHSQNVLKYLKNDEQSESLKLIKKYYSIFKFDKAEKAKLIFKDRIWLGLAENHLELVCNLRNFLKIGY